MEISKTRFWNLAAVAVLAWMLACGCGVAGAKDAGPVDLDEVRGVSCGTCHVKQAWLAQDQGTGPDAESDDGNKTAGIKGDDEKAAETAVQAKDGKGEPGDLEGASDGAVATLAQLHHDSAAIGCSACHDDPRLEGLHEDAAADDRMPRQLRKTAISDELCRGCHTAEALIEATAGLDALTDTEGTTVNPHDLPVSESHNQMTCTLCHEAHDGNADPAETALKKCELCHHTGAYTCGGCHKV